ncbi:MAG: UDP binding domain-containing protein, partial [Puia sp.]
VASETIKLMVKKEIPIKNARILILGFTFKENCPDVRNTRVIDIVRELLTYQTKLSIFDPWAEPGRVKHEYGIDTVDNLDAARGRYDAVILAVAHTEFMDMDIRDFTNPRCVVYDVKGVLKDEVVDARL